MVTQKQAELEVLDKILKSIDNMYREFGEDKYAAKYVKALNKYGKVLEKRYKTVDDLLHPTQGEA